MAATTPRRMQAVFFTQEFPWPLDNGLKLRSFQILSALAKDFDTTLIAFSEVELDQQALDSIRSAIPGLSAIITERHRVRLRRHPIELFCAMLRSMLLRQPFSIVKFFSRSMRRRIDRLAKETTFELGVTTLAMTPYASQLVNANRTIYECQNIESELWNSYCFDATVWKRFCIAHEIRLLKTEECRIWRNSGMVVTLCEDDSAVIEKSRLEPGVAVVPATLPSPAIREAPDRERRPSNQTAMTWSQIAAIWNGGTLGLLGNWRWYPSRAGLEWFLSQVLPGLPIGGPRPRIVLAGVGLTQNDFRRAEMLGIDAMGYVEDLNRFYEQVDIVIGPYFYGGGVRVKILEAMLHRKVVIGTPLAFRGLPLQPGKSAIVCESAGDFADSIRLISAEQEKSQQIALKGCQLAEAIHDESAVRIRFQKEIRSRFHL